MTTDHDDADDFPTPIPGPPGNRGRVVLLILAVTLLLGLILCAGPFAWIWKRAVG